MKDFNIHTPPLKVYGVPNFDKNGIMERVPRAVREQLPSLEYLGRRTPGARLAFRTDSEHFELRIRFESISPDIGMSIFACQSANVYAGGRYLGLARPDNYSQPMAVGKFTKEKTMQDVMIYLPRNEIISDVVVSIDDGARLEAPTPYKHPVPVVFYGSSITEGGCCSRPANAYNALLSRWLDADYYNFGFSGSARGELAMADYITTIEKSVFVMDYDHNSPSEEHLAATHEPFFRRIREREPELPIVILTRPDFDFHAECAPRREIIRATYEHAKAAGDENVYFLDGERFFGDEDRDACTNDCTHPNDLGMYRMAKVIEPVLRGILERAK